MADYRKVLEHSYGIEALSECPPESRCDYLSQHIFNFTTYDGEMGDLFGRKALEVCAAVNDSGTFDYIKDPENYRWYLLLCNTPFFTDKLEWGMSIRGAWWGAARGHKITLQTCGLWDGDEQIVQQLAFTTEEWRAFIAALIEFGLGDGSQK